MAEKTSLYWFKNDLRLHDNEALCHAIASNVPLLFLYVIDERLFQKLPLGFRKAGANRALFLLQSLANLQQQLEALGGHLRVEVGIPENILPKYLKEHHCTTLYAEQEYAWEELQILKKINQQLGHQVNIQLFWGKTLYHIDDIPFAIKDIPLTSKAYRIPTGKQAEVRAPFLVPETVVSAEGSCSSALPTLTQLGFSSEEIKQARPYVPGGETAGLERLHQYTFATEQLTNYRWTRNKSQGMEYSSKFSPYLALGCLSPRQIYQTVKQYEQHVKKNQSTWWLVFELVWRDYFTFKGMRMGTAIFKTEGFRKKELPFENNPSLFKRWCEGQTGIPFVDAHMRQLNATGYMSNRGRVNCSSFLVHDYQIDWTWGAAYFESKLIDYDVSANWMNWHMQAYEIWYTNPVNQSLKYKANAYIKEWIPELREVDSNYIHIPWLSPEPLEYPTPHQVFSKWQRAIRLILKSMEGDTT